MNRWKYALVGLLVGAFAFPLVWNSDPSVIGQTVTVDSTQSPLVVNALADLADLTPTDGQSVIIKTGTEKGLWYYDKDSVAVVDSVAVLTGPGSVGRFLVINNDAGSVAAATAITAAQIDNDVDLEFGVFDADSPRSLTLEELKKTGVQVVNVLQYGADPTGVADSATEIQAAIDSLDFAGGVIYFPEGRYLVESTITLEDAGPLMILGQSTNVMKGTSAAHSSQIVPSASFGATTAIFDVVSNNANHASDHGGITFRDIMIRPASGVRGYAINVRKGASDTSFWGNIRLDNVCIRQCTVGFRLTNSGGVGYGWIYVNDSRVEACTYGVWADCTLNNSTFRNSIIRQNTESSNSSYTSRSGGNIILPYGDAVVIDGCDLEGGQVGIQTGAANVVISGNYFEACYDASIVLQAAEHVNITGNLFASDLKTGQIYCSGCNDVTAENNQGAIPALVGSNRDVFFDSWIDSRLSCTADGGITTATQTVSNVTALVWSEHQVAKLVRYGMDAIKRPSTTPGGTITAWTAGTEGPLGRTSLVGIGTSESAKTYFSIAYSDFASAASIDGASFTSDAGTDVITSAAHGFLDGDQVCVYTTGTLPAGLATAAWYYVRDKTTNTFKVALTHGGSAVDITDAGSGTFYVTDKGEYVTQNLWMKAPKANTGSAPYIEHRRAIHTAGGSTVHYLGTPSSVVFPKDTWLLVQVIEKLPVGVIVGSGGYDCNVRVYQNTIGDSTHVSGVAGTKSRSVFGVPGNFVYFTDVSNENFLQVDERHYIHSTAPTSTVFNWAVGTQIEYITPTAGGNIGVVCTTAGSPGTWKTFGAIAP